jgi:hypothetical protein
MIAQVRDVGVRDPMSNLLFFDLRIAIIFVSSTTANSSETSASRLRVSTVSAFLETNRELDLYRT